jgi:hypothetical protein
MLQFASQIYGKMFIQKFTTFVKENYATVCKNCWNFNERLYTNGCAPFNIVSFYSSPGLVFRIKEASEYVICSMFYVLCL